MSYFTQLAVVTLGLALLALVRSRPAAMMVALNQLITLRALGNIRAYGQPLSEAFLPASIFTERNLDVAEAIFLIATALLSACLLARPRNPEATAPLPVFPLLPRWLLAILFVYLAVASFSTGNLATQAYTGGAGSVGGTGLGGLNALLLSLCLYEVLARSLSHLMRPLIGFGILMLILILTQYSKGSTGLATGYGLCAALFFWPVTGPKPTRRAILSLALLASIATMAYAVRGIRTIYYDRGLASVGEYLAETIRGESERAQQGEGVEKGGNGTQYACHTLECIELYETGIRRGWRSVYDPLIYTAEPSFLVGSLGWTRPIEAAYELSLFYTHGGGTYLLGELYWNGGYLCVGVVFGLLMMLIFYCDTRYRHSPFWLMMSVQFSPGLLMGMGYGFNQVIRGAVNALLVIAVYRVLRVLKQTAARATRDPALQASSQAGWPPSGLRRSGRRGSEGPAA